MMRVSPAVACPSLKTSPSIALWRYQTCVALHQRITACRPAQRAPATSVKRQTRTWATMQASWQISTGMRSPRGGRASLCTMVSSTPILSTSPSTWVRAQQNILSLVWPQNSSVWPSSTCSVVCSQWFQSICVCSGFSYGFCSYNVAYNVRGTHVNFSHHLNLNLKVSPVHHFFLFSVLCTARPLMGETFNTKQMSLTTHDLRYSVSALSSLHKKIFGPDMPYMWVHSHKGMSENFDGFKVDEEDAQLHLTCPDSNWVMAHVCLHSAHIPLQSMLVTNPSKSGCHNTVTTQADEAFLRYDLGQSLTRMQSRHAAFIETCLQHDWCQAMATNQPLCNHFSLKSTFNIIISHYKFSIDLWLQAIFALMSTIIRFYYCKYTVQLTVNETEATKYF